MRAIIKVSSILLLLVNGTGAVYGGYQLITDPSGSKLQMPLSFLDHSPFHNYLIPGVILILVNGIFSFITFSTIVLKPKIYPLFLIAQGILLCGWIIIQMILLQMFYAPLHATFLTIGASLIACGWYLKRTEPKFK
jgi:hypothetical protein